MGASRPIRVLHCPTTVGGQPQALARREREVGLHSMAVTYQQNVYAYRSDAVVWNERDTLVSRMLKCFWLLERALRGFDIIHYNFGETIMPRSLPDAKGGRRLVSLVIRVVEQRDMVLLKRAGKGIVVTFQGDDARQGDYCLAHFATTFAREVPPGYYTPRSDAHKRRRIARFARWADRIYALNPDLLHVLPERAAFLPYANVDVARVRPVAPRRDGPPVVLHAPTHRAVKGTRYVLEALERLRGEGVPFELALVERLPNAEALRLYERADLLVDQLLAGWYGGLALELMALGKPAVAYIREEDLNHIPPGMRADLPLISATPETIYAVLKEWLTVRRGELADLGGRSRAFAERWHDPLRIAAGLKAEYESILASTRAR